MITNSVKTSAPSYHAAIIMDGNGRWAKERGHPRFWGHIRGAAVASKIIEEAVNLKLKAITLFSFSTENWSRPEIEIRVLFKLLGKFILKEKKRALDKKIKFRVIGDLTGLPRETVKIIRDMEDMTRDFGGLKLTLAFGYGGRAEILSAVNLHIKNNPGQEMDMEKLEKNFFAPDLGDVDFLIRTGGDHRVSNFLLWQLAYAELFFLDTKWPEFAPSDLRNVYDRFLKRERRFGFIDATSELKKVSQMAVENKTVIGTKNGK